jgi:thioredoxin 1
MSNVNAVTDETFAAEVERHQGLTVVDFWATWCAPCRMIAPVLDQLATEYAGRARVVKLDTDASPQTMVRYGVRSLPTLLFFKDGQVVDKVVGAMPRAAIEQKLRAHLAPVAAGA